MKNYTKQINSYVEFIEENHLIEANALHQSNFSDIPEASFYKALERLCKSNKLVHLTKGLYYKPKQSRFGQVPISDTEIAEHFTKDGQGIIVGYNLYNNKGITTQVGKTIDVLSNAISGKKKSARNVKIQQVSIQFTPETVPVIEAFEILQNYNKIEDVNDRGLVSYMNEFTEKYSDLAALEVLQNRKYKKSTIAFMKEFLDYHQVPNVLGKYLSSLSNYAIPSMEELYAIK